jgi:hypothetical protein
MNSTLTGSTLSQMLVTAGGSAGFIAAIPHADVKTVLLYFAVIGGTKIVMAASDGVSTALKQGLTYHLLKWMKVPENVASVRKAREAPKAVRTLKPKSH